MSDPGIYNPQQPMQPAQASQQYMTPQQIQQLQRLQYRQALAQSLMGNKAQGVYGGLANAGGDLLGAILSAKAQSAAKPTYGNVDPQAPGLWDKISGLFDMGGGS